MQQVIPARQRRDCRLQHTMQATWGKAPGRRLNQDDRPSHQKMQPVSPSASLLQTMTTTETIAAPTRSQRLKAATSTTHDSLDKRIMSEDIFASRERFAKFVRVQYRFHRDIQALYATPVLQALLPDLEQRQRLDQIVADLGDLQQDIPAGSGIAVAADIDLPQALGWLYVAEGSNLGGTILFKFAGKLGLGADFGASHLAAHPDGAARHWREFTAALDAIDMTDTQEAAAVEGANAAFRTVRGYVEQEFV